MSNNVAQNPFTPFIPTPSAAKPSSAQASPASSAPAKISSAPATSSLTTDLADKRDLTTLGQKLNQIATQLGKEASAADVSAALNTTPMELDPNSSYPKQTTPNTTVAAFIKSQGLALPTDHFSLTGLAKAVTGKSMEHPLGNKGGALSWPVPLSSDEQRRLRTLAMNHAHHLGDPPLVMQTKGGVLAFLSLGQTLPTETLRDPAKLLDALLMTPQAQLMGKALQEKMQGFVTPGSHYDYLLAAITAQLDPESITEPHRNKVAGFDLASSEHIGQPASVILARLTQHLISQGKASPATAAAAAHLLLAPRAPMLLIKDIPDRVTYGSPAWVNLAVAAATIEAQTPGKVANMNFGQVMLDADSAAVADPAVTQNAQKAALLDWGVANGVLTLKDDNLYEAKDLTALINAFTSRTKLMANATTALDQDLPSRREMALAELNKRFPGKEALFEEKVISITTRHDTLSEGGKGVGHGKLVTGLHSMLDVAMMGLKHSDMVFHSGDSRIPIAEMNANTQFSVNDEFDQQFSKGIEDKKAAAGTAIKHLIAQLPLEDRKNFEFGAVSFFQNTFHQLGAGFIDTNPLPPGEELMVKITRNGVTSAYEINFKAGVIKPIPVSQTTLNNPRDARVVHEIKAFKSTDDSALIERTEAQPAGSAPDSFVSPRTQVIADTFVKHMDLDSPRIKAQARGITTEDSRQALAAGVGDFLLNLIPFRSAIVNFQKGNYGEGISDLALDVFGFLTAGFGTVGKALKIGGSALSTATKAFKVAKVIGAATISALNPLGGLGDLTVGAARLTGNGLKSLSSKALQGINHLRGATGSYDLLKAVSKEHGTTLIGTYKAGGFDIEGVAVLKNDRWYKYDHVTNKAYGLPIEEFKPRGAPIFRAQLSGAAEIESDKLHKNLTGARTPTNLAAFNQGYRTGRLETLPGYLPGMSSGKLRALAVASNRSPDEMGILTRELKKAYLEDAKYSAVLLKDDVAGPGVKITAVSQIYYNSKVDLPSIGECAGMSYAMAVAIQTGKEEQFLKNMLKVADGPQTPAADKFINDLRDLQAKVQKSPDFHYGVQAVNVVYQTIIDELARFKTSTTVRIGTRNHAMLAGVRVENGKKEWFFYDPNSGLVKFNNATSMREGMEKVLNSGKIAATNSTDKSATGSRVYSVSQFDSSDLNRPGIDANAVENLSDVEL